MKDHFFYGENTLSPGIAISISQKRIKASIGTDASAKIEKCYNSVQKIIDDDNIVYGVNTGFGPLCSTKISREDTKKLQYNILRSHSAGVGKYVPEIISKLMMILKLHSLSMGYSGIARSTLDRIIWHIENDYTPVVPSQGSVGASGDLAPLAHLFLPLIGCGKVFANDEIVDTDKILARHCLKPLDLGPKEGLALINGTQFIAAYGVMALDRLSNALDCADIIGAMSLEALKGLVSPFDQRLHDLRNFYGCQYVAKRLRLMLENSEILSSHGNCGKVQDPYSLRCIPQVHGASRNSFLHLKNILKTELNSVTDNPVILDDNSTISGGNFHGQPVALPLDYATLAASELGNISDRRTYLLLEGTSDGLPKLLMKNIGINSGFMIPQYTSASLVTENKTLCFPASADSVPTSLGQEDHVSMGSISARKLNRVIDNLEKILSVELVTASQAFDFRAPLKSGPILEACHDLVREKIDHANEDRIFHEDIEEALKLIRSKNLVETSIYAAEKNKIDIKGEDYEIFGIY